MPDQYEYRLEHARLASALQDALRDAFEVGSTHDWEMLLKASRELVDYTRPASAPRPCWHRGPDILDLPVGQGIPRSTEL